MTPLGPLERFAPPRASAALRQRVIAGARTAVSAATPPSRADRIWFSRGWRLAWAAAIAAFALVEAIAVREPSPRPATVSREADAAAAELGIPGRGWTGGEVVGNDAEGREAMEGRL